MFWGHHCKNIQPIYVDNSKKNLNIPHVPP